MRLFTAVDIPDDVKGVISKAMERLRPNAKLKWTNLEKLHITAKFIGEWPEERMEEMTTALHEVKAGGPIGITLRGLHWMPDPRHPRMLWAGVEAGPGLASLAHETEEALHSLGVPVEDRKYSPHLTLARIRDRVSLAPLRQAVEAEGPAEFGSFTASAFYLYLSKDGQYNKLAGFPLA